MAKYYVGYRVSCRYVAEVEADSLDEALEKAEDEFMEADFGDSEDVDGRQKFVENEDGDRVWEDD